MSYPGGTISSARPQLRQSAAALGRGWLQLVKLPTPAAAGSLQRTVPADYWERLLSLSFSLVTSAVAGTRTLALAYQDGDGYTFNLVPISNALGPSLNLNGYADLASVTPVQEPTSFQAEGSATAPAALTTLASVNIPSGGYTVNWTLMLSAAQAATDNDNFGLYLGTTLLLQSVNGTILGQPYPQDTVEVQVPIGGATLAVKNIGAGSAGAGYNAQLSATPSNLPALQVQLPDFMMKSGWQLVLQLGNAQAGDQISAAALLLERYPSSDIQHLAGYSAEALAELLIMGA